MNLNEVSRLFEETLNEEYEADERLTALAVGGVNEEAEQAKAARNNGKQKQPGSAKSSGGKNNAGDQSKGNNCRI